jgi:dephospho-CoA kinase
MATVAIVDYDPNWPDQSRRLAAELRHHLGEAASRIDHIGSTAVPGLAAKDVIDLQVTVASLADAGRLALAFQRAGYLPAPYRHDTGRPATPATRPRGRSACGGRGLGHRRPAPGAVRGR